MVVAWLFLACTGTMTARYGKKINKKVLGKDIWFRIHQVIKTFNIQKIWKEDLKESSWKGHLVQDSLGY
jgi:hypothetical protein